MLNYKPGDLINVITKDDSFTGIYIPQKDEKFISIKLDNGYNIGIDKRKVKEIKILKEYKETTKEIKTKEIKTKGLKKISILHTGGTIASKVDYKTGAVSAKFSPEEILQMFPELKNIANIDSRLIANIMSENMDFSHYNLMAKEIEKEIKKKADGIIITHGTDTMHYSSAALSFILEDLPIPVIFVGAQRSSDRGSSDSAINLLSAAYFIANSDFAEVAVCMHENINDENCLILQGTKVRKMHTSRRDAFRPINTIPYAVVNIKNKNIKFLRKEYPQRSSKIIKLKLFNEKLKIGILKSHPQINPGEILTYKDFDGLVIEGTGLGHIPTDKDTLDAIKKVKAVMVMAPQTIYGRLQMNVYSSGREIQELGILGNYSDMTPETTFIKLVWLLSNYKKEEAKELITVNLRGEISERTEKEAFLI